MKGDIEQLWSMLFKANVSIKRNTKYYDVINKAATTWITA